MKKQMLVPKIKNPVQTCMNCHKTTKPLRGMKERCGICKKIYLIYGDKK